MYKFGNKSLAKLETCHPKLQLLAKFVINISDVDFGVAHGHRGKELQNSLFRSKASKKEWPNSKHNSNPSMAMDIYAYVNGKEDWNKIYYYYFVGLFTTAAKLFGVKIRFGANWDSDGDFQDQTFYDLGHIELMEE